MIRRKNFLPDATVRVMGTAFPGQHSRLISTALLAFSTSAMAAGIGFAFMAWQRASLPFGVTGMVLLLAAPSLALVALLGGNSVSRAPGPMRADSFIDAMDRAESTLRMLRGTRACVFVAAASTFLAWACEALELTDFPDFALCLTLLVAVAAAGYLPWLARQEKLVQEQREQLRRGLHAIRTAEKWFAG